MRPLERLRGASPSRCRTNRKGFGFGDIQIATKLRCAVVSASLTTLAACSGPITAPDGDVGDNISRDLGPSLRLVDDGVYFLTGFIDDDGVYTSTVDAPPEPQSGTALQRPALIEYHVLRWQPEASSYATTYGNIRFYDYDGVLNIMEFHVNFPGAEDEGSMFLPVEIQNDGDRLVAFALNCDAIPDNYRQAQGWTTSDCEAGTARQVLRSFGLVDETGLEQIIFDKVSDLPVPQ